MPKNQYDITITLAGGLQKGTEQLRRALIGFLMSNEFEVATENAEGDLVTYCEGSPHVAPSPDTKVFEGMISLGFNRVRLQSRKPQTKKKKVEAKGK